MEENKNEQKPIEKVPISKLHENASAWTLFRAHTIGGSIRDESDFRTVRYHCNTSLHFMKDILENVEGTQEEKLEFIKKVIEDLAKFTVTVKEEQEVIPQKEDIPGEITAG